MGLYEAPHALLGRKSHVKAPVSSSTPPWLFIFLFIIFFNPQIQREKA